jgi:hypothetical protein
MDTTNKLTLLCAVGLASMCMPLLAQDLPKSGTINFHTGWKVVPEVFETPEKRAVGHGSVVGINFNDQGSGPLHGGPAICVFTFLGKEATDISKGYCAFGDADGDRIFTDWDGANDGKDDKGINRIAGGTGKYRGITGQGPWQCWSTPTPGALRCKQSFDYKLP